MTKQPNLIQIENKVLQVYEDILKAYPCFKDIFHTPNKQFYSQLTVTEQFGYKFHTYRFVTNNPSRIDTEITFILSFNKDLTDEQYMEYLINESTKSLVEVLINNYASDFANKITLHLHTAFVYNQEDFPSLVNNLEGVKDSLKVFLEKRD